MDLDKIRTLIGEMSLEEKAALCGCGADFATRALNRLSVPQVRLPVESNESLTALGCTFSRELMAEYAMRLSAVAVKKNTALAGPLNMGIIRQPMAQGAERMLGEDAYVVSELVDAAVSAAPVKLLASGLLGGEYRFSERSIDSRALNELYLRPFLKVAKKLGGAEIPSGALNGEAVCVSHRFVQKLTESLSAEAIVLNELGSVTDKAAAVAAGASFQIVDNVQDNAALYASVHDGKLLEERLNAVLERVLCFVMSNAQESATPKSEIDVDEFFEQSLAEKSTVLLKNDSVLPLAKGASVAVWGDFNKAETTYLYDLFFTKVKPDYAQTHLVFLRIGAQGLLPEQCNMVQRAVAFNQKTIVVLLSDRAVPLPFEQQVQAVLYVPYVKKMSVMAIGKILTGEVNPGGKLNVSWAYSLQDYPANAFKRAEGRGMFCYESVMNGYRYFNTFSRSVLYPFGHGLSYTGFAVSNTKSAVNGEILTVDFQVKNIGAYDGETVVFAFACLDTPNSFGLKSRLAGFKRIMLSKGSQTHMHFDVNLNELSVYDASKQVWFVPGGKYRIRVGFSSIDMRTEVQVKVPRAGKNMPCLTQKDVPSYYASDVLNPLGADVEKVMGMPLILRKSKVSEFCSHIFGSDGLRKKKAAVKKLMRYSSLSAEEAEKIIDGFSEFALNKFLWE